MFVGEVEPPEAMIRIRRKTTPLFGLGLVDAVPDSTFQNLTKNGGKVNRVLDPVSGTRKVGKFGWKAQVSSLFVFSAEAYVNEMGITSPLFPARAVPQWRLRLDRPRVIPSPMIRRMTGTMCRRSRIL